MSSVQDYPSVDSPQAEPFEGLVEMYYQMRGYITSSNKYFWVREKKKKQRGYKDIDVLATNENETYIVQVSSGLDDKIRYGRDGKVRRDMLSDLKKYFEWVEEYLRSVQDYGWLVNDRKVKRIVAYYYAPKSSKKVKPALKEAGIQLLSAREIFQFLRGEVPEIKRKGLKTNNQLLKMIKLWLDLEVKTAT